VGGKGVSVGVLVGCVGVTVGVLVAVDDGDGVAEGVPAMIVSILTISSSCATEPSPQLERSQARASNIKKIAG
jgi:hypothetical protein